MNTVREIERINAQELERGIAGTPASWHAKYAHAAWVFVGNLDHQLTEGDLICILSQYGEVEDAHLVRDEDTGKSRGFGFAKYEDARSCILAVDNLGGATVLGRTVRVDHVENYRLPKNLQKDNEADDNNGKGTGKSDAREYDDEDVEGENDKKERKKKAKRRRHEE